MKTTIVERRIYKNGLEIDWQGNGIYALVSDVSGKRGHFWSFIKDFDLVTAALQNGLKVEYVYLCNTCIDHVVNVEVQ